MATTNTYKMNNESEATALATYFSTCGVKATAKGLVVKANGDNALLSYLFNKFLTIAIL